jgi:hypothetical protein
MCNDMNTIKTVGVQQAKDIHHYGNIKEKIICYSVHFNTSTFVATIYHITSYVSPVGSNAQNRRIEDGVSLLLEYNNASLANLFPTTSKTNGNLSSITTKAYNDDDRTVCTVRHINALPQA